MSKLAIKGGKKIREKHFPKQDIFDHQEKLAVERVLNRGIFTGYQGNWSDNFWGGPEIRKLEEEIQNKFKVKHAIPCNSATSGLLIACHAIGLAWADEVIVTPYSMTCSATVPLWFHTRPVFADIEPDYFCLDINDIEQKTTQHTKAIIIVDLFGQPYNADAINYLAKKHNLKIIEDAAQAIGSKYYDRYAGTLGDIGAFSFNQGKHLTCGEGGMVVTNDDELAMKCRLTMNHAEAVINDMEENAVFQKVFYKFKNMIGLNLRMTEIQAAIIREQLKKLDWIIDTRQYNADYLSKNLETIPPISPCKTREHCTHVYYTQPFLWDIEKAEGIHRDTFINAVKAELMPRAGRGAEGVAISNGYIKPIYQMPYFGGEKGLCSVCENLYENKLFLHLYLAPPTGIDELNDIIDAFQKVWENRSELKSFYENIKDIDKVI